MKIDSLEIENIRNIGRMKISLSSPLVVISGKNAQGKTTILESIYLLSIGKTIRKGPEKNIVSQWADRAKIAGNFTSKDKEKLKIDFLFGPEKISKINGKVSRLSEVIGEARSVLFTADDLAIIESPQKRRRFINILLSQINKKYLLNLMEYQHVLRRRNKLLYLIKIEKARQGELSFWNSRISALAEEIVAERREIIKEINEFFSKSTFFAGKKLKIVYKPLFEEKDKLEQELERREDKEIVLCQTTIGPHRDNINFYLGDLNLNFQGSRGEKRGAVVELKRAEISIMEKAKGELPILLLDDVFSELDKENKKHIMDAIKKEQTIITTTNEKELGSFIKKAKVYKIKDGRII